MGEYFDEGTETMPPKERQRLYAKNIREIVTYAYEKSPFTKRHFDAVGLKPDEIAGPEDLPKAPIVKKQSIREAHKRFPPFGDLIAVPPEDLQRIFVSPGPIYDPEAKGERRLKESKALYGVGFRPGDRVMETFSYHLVPAGLLFDKALRGLSATVIPAGVGNTELQVTIMRDLKVNGYIGTATFLMNLIKKAEEMGCPFGHQIFLKTALLTGEKVPKPLRVTFEDDYKINTAEAYGGAEIGLYAYECSEKSGMHVTEEVYVEIVDPDTGQRVPDGEVGEIVATHFDLTFPLIRFGTGDLSHMEVEPCPCGRTSPRLGEIVGRVGDSFKVRGMFVHEPQVKDVLQRIEGIGKGVLVITREKQRDKLTFKLELQDESVDKKHVSRRIESSFRDICRLKIDGVEFCPKGKIGPDAKVLKDERRWD
jgi:phenylacetate-CoA ligase